MTTIDRWNQSADAFSSRVDAIAESQWTGSTPCSEMLAFAGRNP